MATKTYAGIEVEVNEEGYLVDHTKWVKEMAPEIASEIDIELTDEHWTIIDFIRKDYGENEKVPTIRRMKKVGKIDTKLLYKLFPNGPVKKAAKIAGYTKPESCV